MVKLHSRYFQHHPDTDDSSINMTQNQVYGISAEKGAEEVIVEPNVVYGITNNITSQQLPKDAYDYI